MTFYLIFITKLWRTNQRRICTVGHIFNWLDSMQPNLIKLKRHTNNIYIQKYNYYFCVLCIDLSYPHPHIPIYGVKYLPWRRGQRRQNWRGVSTPVTSSIPSSSTPFAWGSRKRQRQTNKRKHPGQIWPSENVIKLFFFLIKEFAT